MKKFNFVNRKKITKILIEYILCLMVLEISIILLNMVGISKHVDAMDDLVLTETSNIESAIPDKDSTGSYKVQVLENNALSYYIKVDLNNQIVTVFIRDESGNYTIPLKTMICSTGESTPTEGVFSISDKYAWGDLVGGVWGQYCTRITGPILFHSVPYTSRNKSTLEYWEYDKLGQPVSKGCVRLKVADAKWIYDYCKAGTKVEFVAGEQTKTKMKNDIKLSGYEDSLKGWDPTDPDESNPWLKYNEQE